MKRVEQVLGIEAKRSDDAKAQMKAWQRRHADLELWCGDGRIILFAVSSESQSTLKAIELPTGYIRHKMPKPVFAK